MQKPYLAGAQKRNRARLRLKKGLRKQSARRPRSGRADTRATWMDNIEAAAREPVRCGFGALRVGALLGRLRLHLQTDRFLAVHRGDAMWEAGCLQAALALAEIVSHMAEEDLDLPLAAVQGQSHPSVAADQGWGTRKTGTVTLARCSAELERSAP